MLQTHLIIPPSIKETVTILRNTNDRESYLKMTYDILTHKYHGERIRTVTHIFALLVQDTEKLWRKSGFLHCTHLNILLKTLLIESGLFAEKDVRFQWTHIWYIFPHQYTEVRINNTWIAIDVW